MATLNSPGTSITVTDQSMTISANQGTVPLIFVATKQDKLDATGVVTPGTLKANAGKVYTITSQRDLIQTFGEPDFYQLNGTAVNGYPLNEYGLLAAYSFLGISNTARVVRANINLKQLEATSVQPTSSAAAGTYWLDETSTSFGLFKNNGTTWVKLVPDFIYNVTSGTPVGTDGVIGNVAVLFQSAGGEGDLAEITFWEKTGATTWTKIVGNVVNDPASANGVVMQDVWPIITGTTPPKYWVKTSAPANGASIVLRRMDSTGTFLQVTTPILASDVAANTYYSTSSTGSAGKYYVQNTGTSFLIKISTTTGGNWAGLLNIIGSTSMPLGNPVDGQLWFNAEVGVDANGFSTVDVLVADGNGAWQNVNLPGYALGATKTLYAQSLNPIDDVQISLVAGDYWVNTDNAAYPALYKWSGTAWITVDLTDQVTPNGVIFRDARPRPGFKANGTTYAGENNGGGTNPDLDPDRPDADLYPAGFLLWNTRHSTNNVKAWVSNYSYGGVAASADPGNGDLTGRWVTVSGNDASGKPYMGSAAQQISVVKAIQSVIVSNDEIRADDVYYNLIAAPGYVEAIDEMLSLNDDRKNTAFVVGDTPFTLQPSGTSLQAWATNQNLALGNGPDGLTSASKYFAAWYPSGLSTTLNGLDVVVPPSHMLLRTIAYNDQVSYPWFAPAGLQRGIVNNATTVGYVDGNGLFVPVRLNEGQRDVLYQNGLNPIRIMPQGNIVVFGQKTRQPFASATDRINVVRLENYIRYQLNNLVQPFLFEPNDATTRKAIKTACDRFFSELIVLRAVTDFLTVCDTTNNTPARIDRNELWLDCLIVPTRTVEYIFIPIRIKNTGSTLAL